MTSTKPRTPGTPRRPGSDPAFRTALLTTFAAVFTLLLSPTAQAQSFRAYVATYGNDNNACTLAAPCRLLPTAIAAVASGGEIWMLDSGNYNTRTVDITKSVTILAVPGALGSVVAAGGPAINIATAGVEVALRNLVIGPLSVGAAYSGIVMYAGAELTVENCLIANLPGDGIAVYTPAAVRVTNTTIRDNGIHGLWLLNGPRATVTRATISGNGYDGIIVEGALAGTTTTADISASTIDGNAFGVFALSRNASAVVRVTVRDSRLVRNSAGAGLVARSDFGATVTLSAAKNIVSNNGAGIGALGAGARVWASGNTVNDNGNAGFYNSGALFESAGNNALRNSAIVDTSGTITPIATK